MDKTPLGVNSSVSKRKTLYTPAASIEVPETPEPSQSSHRRHTIFTPNTAPEKRKTPASTVAQKTLLEEYKSTLTFSSTKAPQLERRKTIFDISMDIIDKRVSQINQQSKKTTENNTSAAAEEALKSPPLKPPHSPSIHRQTSLDTFYRKMTKSGEKTNKFKSFASQRSDITSSSASSSGCSSVIPATSTATIPRKRKLFNAQPSITETPPAVVAAPEENPPKRAKTPPVVVASKTPATTAAKRRSMAPATAKAKTTATQLKTTSRRSTILFEPVVPAVAKTTAPRPVMGTQARTMKAALGLPTVLSQQQGSSQPSTSSASQKGGGAGRFRLATTNLHSGQHAFVKEVRLQ